MAVRPWIRLLAWALSLSAGAAATIASSSPSVSCGQSRGHPSASTAWRVVVVVAGEEDPAVAQSVAGLGANTIATLDPPRAESAAAASSAGLGYLPRFSIGDIDRLLTDGAYLAEIRGIPNISGFQYIDSDVEEGYASLETQRYAYQVLKTLFPETLVLYATRLDPIATDPGYLDLYFHPEYTDLVTPYFYPVGTTILGTQEEDDPWPVRLRALLAPLCERMSGDKPILPVLQAFQQTGYPVGRSLIQQQFEVYRELWPANGNAAAFWWGGGLEEPLVGFSLRLDLQSALRGLFGGAASRPSPCVPPPRGRSPRALRPAPPLLWSGRGGDRVGLAGGRHFRGGRGRGGLTYRVVDPPN